MDGCCVGATIGDGSVGFELNLTPVDQVAGIEFDIVLNNPADVDGLVTPVNLTGWTELEAIVRKKALDTGAALATLTCTFVDRPNGRMRFKLAGGQLTCGAKLSDAASRYEWGARYKDSLGTPLALCFGVVAVFRSVFHA